MSNILDAPRSSALPHGCRMWAGCESDLDLSKQGQLQCCSTLSSAQIGDLAQIFREENSSGKLRIQGTRQDHGSLLGETFCMH